MRNFFERPKKLTMLLLAFTLVFAAGCQAISNLDFNTVLKNSLKVTSSESKQSVELKLLLDDAAYEGSSEEDLAMMKLVSNVKLQLNNVKTQDDSHISFDGSLIFGETASIKFTLKMSDTLAVMELEGAKQPFVLDLTSGSLLGMSGVAGLTGLPVETASEEVPGVDEAAVTALGQQLIDTVGTYVIHNLPNPERIDVKPVYETINGTATSLMKVHVDLDGPEIWAWVKKYVDALIADRAGLDKMVAGVFEILQSNPDIWEAAGTIPFEEGGLDTADPAEALKEATDGIALMLTELQDELKLLEEEDQETLDEIFSKDLTIKADVFVDNKLDIRKQVYELSYVPSQTPEIGVLPIKGLTVKFESESWNVNGQVKAEVPVASAKDFPVEKLFSMQGYQVLKQFDEKSAIYDLLKNKLHINKQNLTWYSYQYYNPVIVTASHVTLIPLRNTVEQLGGVLTYDKKTKSLKVFDEATNTTIVLKNGSDTAVVNGKNVKWSFPVTVIDGVTYVPARNLAAAIKAKIGWTDLDEDMKVFSLDREV
ncbi:copper amine oxidase N-terminal domain-containing protein [Paenibacillus sp. LHD-38]|uniref:copper amine oxidase N-terminal domain-containing protein n=1 Tax=Paenibacillus sp. LHD-38 TaxID=3072143 RepID=UPI00280D492F|nr:copper amine oxidase N-terminal domain-containing protein [Paenibacillus sp. LHD-38]MDQ8733187.1 copper amine oxidase N-terminal domain-containing protein [Paenibacillus sp. LHD-38]